MRGVLSFGTMRTLLLLSMHTGNGLAYECGQHAPAFAALCAACVCVLVRFMRMSSEFYCDRSC